MQGKKLPTAKSLWLMPMRLRTWLLMSLKKWAQWQSTWLWRRKAKARKKELQATKLQRSKATVLKDKSPRPLSKKQQE